MLTSPENRILVADDEASICEICFRVLSGLGLEVDCCPNGQEAWEKITRTDYAIILLDIRMPIASGKDVFQHIKQELPDLVERVILTSGDLMNNDTSNFVQKTGRPFLPKPFTPDELTAVVKELHTALYAAEIE
ncbi:MAG: response regulator [Dehalogenimonas sp.]|uniref:Response regulator n=1 Tax=Candidatus Dehalogenimonas loeffleri TaxID=3127115 RepID=A0ABZ2J8Z1_9CHLR|nr:response regulator [Dehalogenimonas sp.]